MRPAVCRKINDRKGRVAVGDSKLIYSPSRGLRYLERGVLTFLLASGVSPGDLDELLAATADDKCSRGSGLPWYDAKNGEPELPVCADSDDLATSAKRLTGNAARRGANPVSMKTAVVFEGLFNQKVKQTGSKAACLWEFVAGHLRAIWDEYTNHRVFVAVDRLGGRKDYRGLLATSLPWTDVVMTGKDATASAYKLTDGPREMEVVFRVGCEETHLPVALASMLAKYVRELFMLRFRSFWQDLAPDVKPTYGYLPDGNRFVEEIQPVIDRLGIDRETLVRNR
jgi:hypothetical protein